MLEDYHKKLENLPAQKLHDLAERYRKTIAKREAQQRDARIVSNMISMLSVVEYTEQELGKKRGELAEIELLLTERKNPIKDGVHFPGPLLDSTTADEQSAGTQGGEQFPSQSAQHMSKGVGDNQIER